MARASRPSLSARPYHKRPNATPSSMGRGMVLPPRTKKSRLRYYLPLAKRYCSLREPMSHNIGRRHLAWGIVFVLNSLVPFFWLGWDMTRSGGRIGMTAATVALWLLGLNLCAKSAAAASVLV